jgi:hypothetical protein
MTKRHYRPADHPRPKEYHEPLGETPATMRYRKLIADRHDLVERVEQELRRQKEHSSTNGFETPFGK